MNKIEKVKEAVYSVCAMMIVGTSSIGLVIVIAALAVGAVKNCAGG